MGEIYELTKPRKSCTKCGAKNPNEAENCQACGMAISYCLDLAPIKPGYCVQLTPSQDIFLGQWRLGTTYHFGPPDRKGFRNIAIPNTRGILEIQPQLVKIKNAAWGSQLLVELQDGYEVALGLMLAI